MRLSKWTLFLGMDDELAATLREFAVIVEPHMDAVMDAVYDHIMASDEARAIFRSGEEMRHARALQKWHWLHHVFSGRYDEDYIDAATRIGHAHFARGIDLHLYVGAYSTVLDRLIDVVVSCFPEDCESRRRYVTALTRAIFLDMGLATSVYYQSEVEQVQELASELNASLARAGEYRDNETGNHITRMSRMCGALAQAIGKDGGWVRTLVMASPLHDVGKIGIPDHILLKPGRLDPEELATMRRHPEIGGNIIPDHPAEVIRMARRISLTHHERWDGSGYPTGLRGEEIPLEGRIAAICDVFDALVSERPYKRAWTVEEASGYLSDNAGKHFDPALVEAFLGIIPQILRIQKTLADPPAAAPRP